MKCLFLITFLLLSVALSAQSTDYDITTEGHWSVVDNNAASFQEYSLRAKLLSKPLNQGKNGILRIHATYGFVKIGFMDHQEVFNDLQQFHSVGLSLGYIKQLKNPKWNFVGMIMPQLNSNFIDGISGDDFYLNALAYFIYSKQKDTRFSMGFVYTNTFGFPAPIPIFSYWKAWNDKWEMNFGFPRINLTHHFNEKTSLIAYSELKGYSGNISKPINNPIFRENRTAQRIGYSDVLAGLEWQWKLKRLQLRINASYPIYRDFKLRNSNNDVAYKFDMGNNLNIGVGIDIDL